MTPGARERECSKAKCARATVGKGGVFVAGTARRSPIGAREWQRGHLFGEEDGLWELVSSRLWIWELRQS
jgi:hypothetical protein